MEESKQDTIYSLYKKDSAIEVVLPGDSSNGYVYNNNGGSWLQANDSYNFDSDLIPLIKEIDGKESLLMSLQFSVSKSNSNSSYGGESSSSYTSYLLSWEDGTEITSGTTCSNLYINLLNYDLEGNTAIRLTSSGGGSAMTGNWTNCAASFSASISDVVLTYKCFSN